MRKAGPLRDIPPPLELECLKALWSLGEGKVKDVRLALTGRRNLAYTTVMTILDRLQRKGTVARRKVGRSFLYVPVLSQDTLRRLAVRELAESFFDGSEESLLAYLQNSGGKAPEFRERDATYIPDDRLDTALL